MPKQAIIYYPKDELEVAFIETPIPTPRGDDVVIKVAVAGSNPKDWKFPLWKDWPHNSGDDIAGIVHAVGPKVYEFKPGDRVAALHEFGKDHGGYSEYAVAPDRVTFHLSPNISFEEAATVPTAALAASMGLFADLGLPAPWDANTCRGVNSNQIVPLLIYGVGSAVGSFAAKLARIVGIYPVIGVAGSSQDYARTLVDYVIDHRKGEDAVVAAVEEALRLEGLSPKVPYVLDAISEQGSLEATCRVIDPNIGRVSTTLPPVLFAKEGQSFAYPAGVSAVKSVTRHVHATREDWGYTSTRHISRLLNDGRLTPHAYEVVPGGLNGVCTGLRKLRQGRARAFKYVYRIDETGDVSVSEHPKVSCQQRPNNHPLRNFPLPSTD